MDEMLEYLKQVKFDRQLKKLNKKLKGKTIVIYGSGLLFQKVLSNYDLSELNIIGISDRKYIEDDEGKKDLGYPIVPLTKIVDYKPDYVLISTLKFLEIMDNFIHKDFKGTKIKVLPLVDKPFWKMIKEIFE